MTVEQVVEFLDGVDIHRSHGIEFVAQFRDKSLDLFPVEFGFNGLDGNFDRLFASLGCGLQRSDFIDLGPFGGIIGNRFHLPALAVVAHRTVQRISVELNLDQFHVMTAANVLREILRLEPQLGGPDLEFALLLLHLAVCAALLA